MSLVVLLIREALSPREHALLFPAFATGVDALKLLSTSVFLELPGVGEAVAAALAGV